MSNYIEDLEEVRKYLEKEENIIRVNILGKSFGAMCALGYALKYPDAIDSLILAAGSPSYQFLQKSVENFKKKFSVRQPAEERLVS